MKYYQYSLLIYFPKFSFKIPFSNLDEIYLFIFSLKYINPAVYYLIRDVYHDRILDILWASHA